MGTVDKVINEVQLLLAFYIGSAFVKVIAEIFHSFYSYGDTPKRYFLKTEIADICMKYNL